MIFELWKTKFMQIPWSATRLVAGVAVLLPLISISSCGDAAAPATEAAAEAETPPRMEYVLVWADEFDGQGLPDSTRWSFEVGDGCPDLCGWGNNEQQYYTAAQTGNARQEDGRLIIEAHQGAHGSREYTSARLVTKGKGDWRYGRVEVRAKLPSGRGTWPAIWMLPTDWAYGGWPASGEIDIMEHVGHVPDTIYGTVHTEAFNHLRGTQRGNQVAVPDSESEFYVYAIEWSEEKIDFFIENWRYHRFEKTGSGHEVWPFNKRFYLLLNLAVGGNWGGAQGIDSDIWPQRMEVDYVRVYQEMPAQ